MREPTVGDALAKNNLLNQFTLLKKKLIVLNQQWMRDCLDSLPGYRGGDRRLWWIDRWAASG